MLSTLFLVSTLLLSHSLGALDSDAAKTVVASVGGAVILPCHISVSDDLPTVEWLKEGLVPNTVFLYRQGCEIHVEKNQAFWYRSSLIMSELKNGNISLRISPVRLSDEGRYKCMTIRKTDPQTSATVDLIVGAASEPKLSVIPAGGDGLTLQCEASCWYPRPVITFLNDQGDDIGGDNPKHEPSEDPQHENCFNTWRRVTLQTPVGRVICRAHEPSMNQTRTTEIYIPVRSKVLDIIITAFVIAFVIGLGLCTFYLCKRVYRNHTAERPKWMIFGQCLGGQSTTIGNTDGLHHRGNLADATGGNSAEHQISIEDLRQTVGAKDIIQKQTPELNELKSKQTPDVSKSCMEDLQPYKALMGQYLEFQSREPNQAVLLTWTKVAMGCPVLTQPLLQMKSLLAVP
ncbi:butyrophilin subfamily 3 member A2-like isoform X1 [Xyrichtys novacula]|uniref:Butyrophilin subfamily 3 member A2-like isoform X1 n=1 Tax=Xyrichtys novacula TaxID=13765 RepID=A0AAV1HIZ8_XYRNO|nr:butyrophilin subfamily 3 member A2-like isoform X1 [Xyrichtys novacula]